MQPAPTEIEQAIQKHSHPFSQDARIVATLLAACEKLRATTLRGLYECGLTAIKKEGPGDTDTRYITLAQAILKDNLGVALYTPT